VEDRTLGHSIDKKIYLAFRFHVNFYHSYRGDTPDEAGFGKDIRIIRRIIEVLDAFNAEGVPARGTWDVENYFSLEKIMPKHCPDIIESWKRRAAEGKDEIQLMSYNNGLISAHTAAEFDYAIGHAISNQEGSGLKDLFGDFGPMVRPQEMMYTPLHLKMYPAHGVNHISLFYSSVPFNGFSNFIKPLPFEQRFNPLTLTYPGIEETMTLVPAYNHGDIADNISLRWWLKRIRKKQLGMAEPKDLLLLIDADADDEYWNGFDWPVVSKLLAAAQGIRGLIQSVCDLDFLKFTTPSEYVKTHPPLGPVTIGQDTADGGFDGFSSWAEKWSNHRLWTGIERSRILELQARRLMDGLESAGNKEEIETLIAESFQARLRALSTTHFGLASPVMNVARLKSASDLVGTSVDKASEAFERAAESAFTATDRKEDAAAFTLVDYVRGISTKMVEYNPKPSRALLRIPLALSGKSPADISVRDSNNNALNVAIRRIGSKESADDFELLFVENMEGNEHKDFRLDLTGKPDEAAPLSMPASVEDTILRNEFMEVCFDKNGHIIKCLFSGTDFVRDTLIRSAINYSGQILEVSRWTIEEKVVLGNGLIALMRLKGAIPFEANEEQQVSLVREFMLVAGLPYLYIDTHITYPRTHSDNYSKARARMLQQEYDNNWREVMPCEIRPALLGTEKKPLRVWKHNYLDHMSRYDLNYAQFSKNRELDSFNNHVTHAWVAVTDREKGLLLGQTADVNACFAFCPMRTRASSKDTRIFLNPFGNYHGKQFDYVTAFSGIGKFIALKMAESLDPLAPSYNGRFESFRLMLAPYLGDEPPEEIRNDAEAFAYPYTLISRSKAIKLPPHRKWAAPIGIT